MLSPNRCPPTRGSWRRRHRHCPWSEGICYGTNSAITARDRWIRAKAWDYAFRDREPSYVRVLTRDGRWVGGWLGPASFASSYPQPKELFIQTAHRMEEDGSFGEETPGTVGIYVQCEDALVVEFVEEVKPNAEHEAVASTQERGLPAAGEEDQP